VDHFPCRKYARYGTYLSYNHSDLNYSSIGVDIDKKSREDLLGPKKFLLGTSFHRDILDTNDTR